MKCWKVYVYICTMSARVTECFLHNLNISSDWRWEGHDHHHPRHPGGPGGGGGLQRRHERGGVPGRAQYQEHVDSQLRYKVNSSNCMISILLHLKSFLCWRLINNCNSVEEKEKAERSTDQDDVKPFQRPSIIVAPKRVSNVQTQPSTSGLYKESKRAIAEREKVKKFPFHF